MPRSFSGPRDRSDARTLAAAEIAAAKRKVKQAGDLCRRAAQRLAETQQIDVYGAQRVETQSDLARAAELIALAHSEHQQIDVVVLASPKP